MYLSPRSICSNGSLVVILRSCGIPNALDFLFFALEFQLLSYVHNVSRHKYCLALTILICAYNLYVSMLIDDEVANELDVKVMINNITVACRVGLRELTATAALVE